jgi:uncharacterized protein YqgV (UPF0045/DUF77 family)
MPESASQIMAEVAVYPLRELEVGLFLLEFLQRLRRPGLRVEPGPMSTLLVGEAHTVFAALEEAFAWANASRQVVLRVTLTGGGAREVSPEGAPKSLS